MKETTYLSVLVFIFIIARIIKAVCLKGEVVGDALHLSCKVERLKADIEIYSPDKKLFGSCPGPTKYSKNLEICDKKLNMTQNISTKTTKLVVKRNKLFSFYGEWMCKHGTGLGSDTFVVMNTQENKKTDCSNSILIIFTGFLFLVIIVLVTVMLKLETFNSLHTKLCQTGSSQPRQTPGEVENPLIDFSQPRQTPGEEEKPLLDFSQPRQTPGEGEKPLLDFSQPQQTPGEEEKPLLDTGSSTSANECLKCKMLSACALCVDCNCFYCEICCDTHTKGNPKHKVCMIEHTIKSVFDVNCSKCKNKEPTVVCTTCKKVLCDNCTCEHEADRVNIELIKHKPRAKRTISSCSSELKILQEIKIKNVHVCGICILDDGQIVIGDRKNGQLLTPIKVDEIDTFNLKFEPRGLVHMYGKKIAVTSSHDKTIIIFELGNPSWTESKKLKCDDKPFSISYNDDHFAVEFEESEDGFIGILTTGGEMMHRIENTCDFAYFTGNTIRLALDMKKGLVFVSALSKKLVSCVDFSGKIVWHVPISSPRGIIFVPGIAVGHKNIVCASKRHNTVYEMGSENGDFEVLLSGRKIPGPRYITYSLQLKKLCIQADNGQFLVYTYKIY